MGSAVLLLLVLTAVTPLLSAVKALDYYSTTKYSKTWYNSNNFFGDHNLGRNILTIQPHDPYGVAPYIGAGFFSVSSSKFVFAVSIYTSAEFYNGQIVWSANEARPVSGGASLELTTDGNLVLGDVDGSHVWSSNNTDRSIAGMKITKIGNLVLFDQMNATVWQSFDYPTDTMVPGQSLAEGMRLTTTNSAANMYITVQPNGLAAYVESTPPQLYFGDDLMQDDIEDYPTKVTLLDGGLSFKFGSFRSSIITLPVAQYSQYMRLDSDGHLRLYEWAWPDGSWTVVYDILGSTGMNACDYPTACGEYGVCTEGQCTCPLENNSSSTYFKPVDERKPNLGCTPLTPVSCQQIQHHRLVAIPNIYYHDNYTNEDEINNKETTIDGCKQVCLKNCSCMAVLFKGGKCVWVTKVFSLHSIDPDSVGYYSSPAYLKVQLRPSNGNKEKAQLSTSNKNKNKLVLSATLGAVTVLVLVVIVVALYVRRMRRYKEKDEEFDFGQLPRMPTRFSFEMLRGCTEGFSKKLGEGGFGSVFEGKLGEERVAVKRLEGARQGKK